MDFGGGSTVAVAAASTAVLAPRFGRRVAFSISNYGTTTVFLTFSDSQVAAANRGLALYPGTSMGDSNSDTYRCWQGAITAFEASGAGTLSVWERLEG